MSGKKSSEATKGKDWAKSLSFTPDSINPGASTVEVPDDDLIKYFANIEGSKESIVKVMIFKNSSFKKWFGGWHEFIVVESANWFWSFDTDSKGIHVQRGKSLESVKDYYRGAKRIGTVESDESGSEYGKGNIIRDIFAWIHEKEYLNHSHRHIAKSNCHYFASLLFKAIARQKGRQLVVPTVRVHADRSMSISPVSVLMVPETVQSRRESMAGPMGRRKSSFLEVNIPEYYVEKIENPEITHKIYGQAF